MRPPKLRSGGGAKAWFWVASVTRLSGFEVGAEGLIWGDCPVGYGGSLLIWPASMVKPGW